MKLPTKSIFIRILIIFSIIIITYAVTTWRDNASFLRTYGNLAGYELKSKFLLLEISRDEAATVQKIQYSIERDIVRALVEASMLNPPIEDLQGAPIDAFNKIIEYHKTNSLLSEYENETDEQLRKIALEYLIKIEPDVSKRVEARKKIFREMGEHMRKQFE